MKTTLDLPDDLVKAVKLRAVHEGKKLKDSVAELLREGLAAANAGSRTVLKADKSALKLRTELTRKFVAGEWGVDLTGFEEGRKTDRRKTSQRAKAWRG